MRRLTGYDIDNYYFRSSIRRLQLDKKYYEFMEEITAEGSYRYIEKRNTCYRATPSPFLYIDGLQERRMIRKW